MLLLFPFNMGFIVCSLLVGAIQSSLYASVLFLQLVQVHLHPAQLLLLTFHHSIQLLDVFSVLLLHLLFAVQHLNRYKTVA